MKPFTRTIIDLFDGKRRYLIPLYQRQYAWRVAPQLELLWLDIAREAGRLEKGGGSVAPHFMGAIVIAQMKTYGKQVFNNSRPQDLEATIEDTVDKTQSALKKRLPKAQRFVKESQESFLEELRKEEKDGLSKIIMENE